jgi:hypothetical protein
MEKIKLDGFIKRYNLAGCIESVKVESSKDDNNIKTSFISEEKHVIGNVELKQNNFGDYTLGVADTAKLKGLLGVLGSDIDVSTTSADDRVISINLSDKNTDVNCILSDISVIPKVPNFKGSPEWDVTIPIDCEFADRFKRSKGALPDVNTFTLVKDKKSKKLKLVIGYSSINSNRISLDVETEDDEITLEKPISFSAKYLKELLQANSDATEAKLEVSAKGLAHIKFSTDDYESEYFLTEIPQGN